MSHIDRLIRSGVIVVGLTFGAVGVAEAQSVDLSKGDITRASGESVRVSVGPERQRPLPIVTPLPIREVTRTKTIAPRDPAAELAVWLGVVSVGSVVFGYGGLRYINHGRDDSKSHKRRRGLFVDPTTYGSQTEMRNRK